MIPLAVWVYFRRDRKWGLRIAVAAVAWMVFAYTVVINTLLGTMSFYANRIPFGGLGGLVSHGGGPSGAVLALHPQRRPALLPVADGRRRSVSGSWSRPSSPPSAC